MYQWIQLGDENRVGCVDQKMPFWTYNAKVLAVEWENVKLFEWGWVERRYWKTHCWTKKHCFVHALSEEYQ